jgi:RimJ/RimL family protein N-acetyltransferase
MIFDLKEKYLLENDRVLLRPMESDDVNVLLEYSLNEPGLFKFNINGPVGKANLDKYIATALNQRKEGTAYPFVVFDKLKNKVAGCTRFYEISNDLKRLELGYTWYGREFQGSGLNKNCKYLMLEFAFEKMDMIRVGFGANSKNEKSIAAMKSIGCTVEGILRHYGRDGEGQVMDSIKLSILKGEWFDRVKADLWKQMNGRKDV